MRLNGWGRIVNVSSTAAADGAAGLVWYAMAKSSLVGLTRSLAKELVSDGILVNIVMPGPTSTRLTESLPPGASQSLARMSLLRRLLKPEEVAAAVAFLASAANGAITGEVLRVSGG